MQSPAVSYKASPAAASASIVSNDNESVNEDDDSSIEENEMVGDMMVIEEVMKDRTENHTNDDSSDSNIMLWSTKIRCDCVRIGS